MTEITDAELRDAAARIAIVNPEAVTPRNVVDLVRARRADARDAAKRADLLDLAREREYWRLVDELTARWLGRVQPLDCSKVMPDGSIVDTFSETVDAITRRAHDAAAQIVYETRGGIGLTY